MLIWNPDTCKCKFEIESQDENGKFIFRSENLCNEHLLLNMNGNDVMAENRRKNNLLGTIAAALHRPLSEISWGVDPVTRKFNFFVADATETELDQIAEIIESQ